ncbi:hypothetical protein [Pectobacterium carotovorum]|uniref:hypothetical protein n=1 Tax=Pectobacterium carotovorum TaxID=554 RepID=UPI0009218297|nr:hypothetical protein [Pectobacterium carotovorum]SHG90722.1 hypothetical protein SAMN05444147_10555 [Pectobacterium carotovorum]
MSEQLKKCIVCNKELSALATTCNGCNSPDPFGHNQARIRLHNRITLLIIAVIFSGLALWYFGVIDPIKLLGLDKIIK